MASTTAERREGRPRAIDAATACEGFQITAESSPEAIALRTKDDAFSCTWGEYAKRVEKVAAGLAALGVGRGDTVALMLTNRPEFHIADAAAMHLGAVAFSIYNTYTPEQIGFLLQDAANRVAITEQGFLDRFEAVRGGDNALEHVVVVDGEGGDGVMTLDDVASSPDAGFDFEAAWRAVEPDDVLTLIYTSGTTGPPKGVQITHANICETVRSYDQIIEFEEGGRVVSYLPMAHVAERNVSHYLAMLCGFTVTCCPDPRAVAQYLPGVHPTWFFGVPRIYEKMKAGLEAMLAGLPEGEQKAGLQAALELSLRRVKLVQAGEPVPDDLDARWREVDDQILKNIRTMLGFDQLKAINVGAAPTPPEVIEFFHALGIPLAELWGMSETSGAGTCNPPERIKIGTVGPAAPGIEIKLADDGEVLIRGACVMAGYRNEPEKTREAFTDAGFLMTGDIGELDEDGYLKIVDRKKELIIGASGKNMSPANIESKLKAAGPLIGQAIAIGDGRPYNVALLTLDPDALPALAGELGMEPDADVLAADERVLARVAEEVERANEQMARVEQIKRFKLLAAEWQPGGEELTPTMKLKRKPVAEKYATEIEALYAG
jgi:long-subunit acyl-CoA synthetase (AMP-forming)